MAKIGSETIGSETQGFGINAALADGENPVPPPKAPDISECRSLE